MPLAVSAATPDSAERALVLARELGLPLVVPDDPRFPVRLTVTAERLELRATGQGGPVHAEFAAGRTDYRRRQGGLRSEPLARAVGLKSGFRPEVIDACGGLGRDAFVLAGLGCRVRLLERSPVIAALLRDALTRAGSDEAAARLHLIAVDAREYLAELAPTAHPDVIYLDPMYPHRTRSALVKKEMRVLRMVVGEDSDAPALLAVALHRARRRVVVKRPRPAPILDGPTPDLTFPGSSTRFDVYLIDPGRPAGA